MTYTRARTCQRTAGSSEGRHWVHSTSATTSTALLYNTSEVVDRMAREGVMTVRTKQRLWTVEDVGEFLGVPVRTLYDWRGRGYGPMGKKVGRYLRYDPAEVERWFDSLGGDVA